ncbi:hypothetical protein Dsin_012619 [Dipteronia sinensis]|uniref:HAT C-terminal dimerisation domain-containing protein n=1 Tax=Dipteronia sinensis TaxID=43782 RepID=A0AAE0E8C2_9ROSI|nr:hypothetical protein Dsin_012619 [Dipteronia sinensis]
MTSSHISLEVPTVRLNRGHQTETGFEKPKPVSKNRTGTVTVTGRLRNRLETGSEPVRLRLRPNPPLIIFDEPDPNLYDPDSNENLSTPQPPSNEFVAGEEEKPMKSDLFKLHMKKIQLDDGMIQIKCNYCSKIYRTNKSFGYGTYWNHIRKNHPSELVKTSNQSQISRYGTPTNQLFHYTSEKNKEELAVMVAVEHLPFSFGEKVGFVNYCQNALNPAMQRVPRSTLTRTMFSIYKKQKNKLKSFFYQFEGRVSVCADIWTDNFGSHHYMGVTCHYMDNDWVMQKRIIAFRVFDESHTAQNIFRLLKIIFEEFHIQNKIFTIGFDNAASNTASIPMLQDLCNPYFGECLQDYLTHYYKSLDLEVDVLSYCNSIKALLYELYDEYLKIYGLSLNMPVSQHQPTSDSTGTSSTFKLKGLGDRLFSQRAKKLRTSSSSSSGSISKLDRYLETSHEFLEDSEFSIQVWWKDHEQIFPILAIIAKQILGTPVSTVAVEQEFSAGGNILEPRRFCLEKINKTETETEINRNRNRRNRNRKPNRFFRLRLRFGWPRNRNRWFRNRNRPKTEPWPPLYLPPITPKFIIIGK